jgi:hypothetical protein
VTSRFRLCVAAIAAHVIDDSFVQPEPGTSAGDHLVSGLAPLAVLAAAAWAYGRVRAGTRGTLALVLGVFGIVAGAPKQLWEIPGAGHTGGLETRPREYERRVIGFLDEALLR